MAGASQRRVLTRGAIHSEFTATVGRGWAAGRRETLTTDENYSAVFSQLNWYARIGSRLVKRIGTRSQRRSRGFKSHHLHCPDNATMSTFVSPGRGFARLPARSGHLGGATRTLCLVVGELCRSSAEQSGRVPSDHDDARRSASNGTTGIAIATGLQSGRLSRL